MSDGGDDVSIKKTASACRWWRVLVVGGVLFLLVVSYTLYHHHHPASLTLISIQEQPPSCHTQPKPPTTRDDRHRVHDFNMKLNHLHSPGMKRRLPGAIIIGARKCGTRALLEFLSLHRLLVSAGSEIHFFDDDERYDGGNGIDWYRKRMPFSFEDQMTVEKSPSYFIIQEAPARIHHMNESIKLLLIVREPTERLISDYAQLRANKIRKGKHVQPFRGLVLRDDGSINTSYKAVRIGLYQRHLLNWYKYFRKENIHIVDGDSLINSPYQVVRDVEAFLGLPHEIDPSWFYYNSTKGFYCIRNDTVDKCLAQSKGREHPYIEPWLITRLRHFYRPYNKKFFKLIHRTFAWN